MTAALIAGDPFEALGDPTRRAILAILGDGESSVQQIAEKLPVSRPAVSRHLKLLGDAGLVSSERRGTRQVYQLQEQGVRAVQEYLQRVWGDVGTRFTLFAENTRPEDKTREE